ncbi:MAG: hypothetical protein EZS28_007376 [Streblomastix strix]|uniref:Palmitoyltransferase n=1 Tax=Streblomastix strix TaxID=222440 RepID=A0A5J4WRB4_9EUKA|nr:MAG: hypothetical protein EZS28_007376 [Streblomastix strix]
MALGFFIDQLLFAFVAIASFFVVIFEAIPAIKQTDIAKAIFIIIGFEFIGGYILILKPYIDSGYVSRINNIIIPILLIATSYIYYTACTTDEGKIDKTNAAVFELIYPYDGLSVPQVRYCKECGFIKPPRSRHCPTSNYCVARYDHFCPIVAENVDVSEKLEGYPPTCNEDIVDDLKYMKFEKNRYDRGQVNNLLEIINPPHTWKIYKDMIDQKKIEYGQNQEQKEQENQIDLKTQLSTSYFDEHLDSVSKLPLSFSSVFPRYFPNRFPFHWLVQGSPKEVQRQCIAHEKERAERLKRNEKRKQIEGNQEENANEAIIEEDETISSFGEWLELYKKLRSEAIIEGLKENDEKSTDQKTEKEEVKRD